MLKTVKSGKVQNPQEVFEPQDSAVVEVCTWAVWLYELTNQLFQLNQVELNLCHLHQSVPLSEARLARTSLWGLQ